MPHLSPEAFQEYWRTAHADAASRIPGLRRYVQNHQILVAGHPVLPYPGFDACAELEFDSIEDHDAGFSSPEYLSAVRTDEDRFVDKSRFSVVLAEREMLLDRGLTEEPVKLLVGWRLHPASSPGALLEAADRWAERIHQDKTVLRHDRLVADPSWHSEGTPAACHHVDLLWFAELDVGREHLAGPAHEADLTTAGAAFGAARTLTRPVLFRAEGV
ncbi:EthD domain-containing protein [Euzebya tangerina]|uniref:EthD domain-containing protein n=1 Tax=Euzebya tangerina TaxID=591198 RepID=UPI0013C34F96|nr:EthD domain-containing protein [Euzebya tangerina]